MAPDLLASVIIVSKNARSTIRRCLDSIFNQSYRNLEITVVDSSNDETIDIIEEYRRRSPFPFKVIRQPPMGVGVARNTGIENSSGEVLVFVDVDAWLDNDYLEKVTKVFSESEKILTVFTDKEQIEPSKSLFSELVDLYERIMHFDEVTSERHKIDPLVARKKLFDITGKFSQELTAGEDAELWYRVVAMREELEERGYRFAVLYGTKKYEEKQGTDFFSYFRRCRWYGRPLANKIYFNSNPLRNMVRILLGAYFVSIIPILIYMIIARFEAVYLILALLPFLMLYIYIILKSIRIKKFRWTVFLMPVLLFYKFIGLFAGFVDGLTSRSRTVEKAYG